MDRKILSVFVAALLSNLAQVSGWGASYRGAVVEYNAVMGTNDEDTMNKNAKKFIEFIQEASAKKADIIVFPEGGLYSKINSPIPDPADEIIPCDDSFETTKAVKNLSCASKKYRIYSVVNLREKRNCSSDDPNCPSAGYYIFNTNVVFDRNGTVIARYAKYNLFATDVADQPPEPEMSFFDTDFGVRFGMFICFDLIFQTPTLRLVQQYGITDFVFSTFWYSELPFLTALQAQRGWAEANNVNLLASGSNLPMSGSAGSGIYNGKFGQLVQIMPEKETSKLLIADVPKIKKSEVIARSIDYAFTRPKNVSSTFSAVPVSPVADVEFKFLRNPQLNSFISEVIKAEDKFEKTVCAADKFCCDFKVTMDILMNDSKNYTYRAVVYNGPRQFGEKFRGGVQVCAVIVCSGPDIKDCGNREKKLPGLFKFKEILIKGSFKWRNSFQMPSTLTDGQEVKPLDANQYEFTRNESHKSMDVSLELLWPVYNLHTFAIWGRDFTRDNEPNVPQSRASTLVSAPVLFAAFLSFFLFVR